MNAPSLGCRPVSQLYPGPDDRRSGEDFLTSALGDALQRIEGGSVGPDLDMDRFRKDLGGFDFLTRRPLPDLLQWVIGQLEHGVVHLTHPRYFGLFNPSPSFPAECAERIVAAFNPQLATWTTSPVAVEMEAHVIRSVARRAGFAEDATGHFTTGGSEANLTALICALTSANPGFAANGAFAFDGPPTIYVSQDAHLCWHKIAHQSGIGRSSVRLVPTDRSGRMDMCALAATLESDRANGRTPVMLVATAGTTGAGMIDPLADCAELARTTGVWFHVDAAWGGALIASETLSKALAGIERAQSATIDAHKWFATTMSCGMFLTRNARALSDAFHVTADFMPSNARHLDPYVTTTQWSRRFLGLRLFLSLASVGWRGHAEPVERSIQLISILKDELTAQGWTAANDSPLAVLCVDPPPGFPGARAIARDVVASGLAWVSSTIFQGRDVVRMCVTNGRTTSDDVSALARLLQTFKPSSAACRPDSSLQCESL